MTASSCHDRPVMKMIGVARLRSRERIIRAVSKPSMVGIATSRMISAKS